MDLSTIDGLFEVIRDESFNFFQNGWTLRNGKLFCPYCGDMRRMAITRLFNRRRPDEDDFASGAALEKLTPSLYKYSCVQCEMTFTALIYEGVAGSSLAVLPSHSGGLTTPHTPPGVSYYLDQAYKAQSMGANSAATAMYRGALEHLLFEQGYTVGMLGAKIKKLNDDISNGTAPKWAKELETDFLSVLGELGNGSIHPNDGDVTKQSALDSALLAQVQELFLMLLFLVYEVDHKKNASLSALRTKAALLKK